MKYCPYCGSKLLNPQASFCVECGKPLSTETQDVSSGNEKKQEHNEHRRKHMKKAKVKSRQKEQSVAADSEKKVEKTKEDDYDGYYDDVCPVDEGSGREEINKDMIKKILLLVAGVLFIAGACVALMYLL